MPTDALSATSRLVMASLVAVAACALAGCQFRPNILSAKSPRLGDNEGVEVELRSSDAKIIKDRELYVSINVADCAGNGNSFPAEAYVGGQRASDFQFATSGETVTLLASVPTKIFDAYQRPCVFLQGGSYFMGTIESATIPIGVR